MNRAWIPWLPALLLACSGPPAAAPRPAEVGVAVSFRAIGDSLRPAADVQRMVEPYRTRVAAAVSEVLATAEDRIVKARPEGALGALVADAVLESARSLSTHPVDAALVNDGALRAPIPAGPVTVGSIFEVMPFENTITLLELTGVQMEALADEIAEGGGDPVAGMTFDLHGPELDAQDLRIDGTPVEPGRTYWVAVPDFLAGGGGSFRTLLDPITREDLPFLVRDAITQHVTRLGRLSDARPGRIRVTGS
ncbi:MAG: 5'-nucleotidase [Gemmatimonadota bacterium]